MKRFLLGLAALFLLAGSGAIAQTIQQAGSVTSGHVPCWVTSGVVQDCSSGASSKITGLGLVALGGTPLTISNYSATNSGGYAQIGLGVSSSAASINLTSTGGYASLPMSFIVNGVTGLSFTAAGIPNFPNGFTAGTNSLVLTGSVLGQLSASNSSGTAEFDIQNTSAGSTASTDFIVNADNATSTSYYGDFGINSSNNSDSSFTAFAANDVYLYSASSNLDLATATSGKNINFYVGGTLSSNKIFQLTSSGAAVTGTLTTSGATTVTGTLTATTLSGTNLAVSGGTVSLPSGSIGNSSLVNSSTIVNGQTCALGSGCTITAAAGSISVGTTTVLSGSSGYILYNNAGTLGNLATTGTGNAVLATSPTISTGLALSTSGTSAGVTQTGYSGGSVAANATYSANIYRGTSVSPAAVVTGDNLWGINVNGYDGSALQNSGNLIFSTTGSISSGIVPGSFTVQVANSSGVLTTVESCTASGCSFPTSTISFSSVTASTVALGGCTIGADVFCVTGTSTISSTVTGGSFIPSSSSVPTNGLYLPSSNTPAISANSTKVASFTSGTNAFTFAGGTNPTIGTSGGNLVLTGSAGVVNASYGGTSIFGISDTSQGTDLKNWRLLSTSSNFRLDAVQDSFSGSATLAYLITRGTTYNVAYHSFFTSTSAGTAYEQVRITNTASAANYLTLTGGTNPTIGTSGGGLNVSLATGNAFTVGGPNYQSMYLTSSSSSSASAQYFAQTGTASWIFGTRNDGTYVTSNHFFLYDNTNSHNVLDISSGTNGFTFAGGTNPTIGTSGGNLLLSPNSSIVQVNNIVQLGSGSANPALLYYDGTLGTDLKRWQLYNLSGNYAIYAAKDDQSASTLAYQITRGTTYNVAYHSFYTSSSLTDSEQVRITNTASAANYLTLTGGTNPTIGTSGGGLTLQTASTTAMTLDSSRRVQIPNGGLTIGSSTSTSGGLVVTSATGSAPNNNTSIQYTGSASYFDAAGGGSAYTAVYFRQGTSGAMSTTQSYLQVDTSNNTTLGANNSTTTKLQDPTVAMPNIGSGSGTYPACWTTTSGNITKVTSGGCSTSLEELKYGMDKPIDPDEALTKVTALNTFWGGFKSADYGETREQPMFGAHQVESVDPRLTTRDDDETLRGVRYEHMTVIEAAAIKALLAKIQALETKVSDLEAKASNQTPAVTGTTN